MSSSGARSHFLVASAPQAVVTPTQDCLIALSYFELYARVNGVGTVWDGLATLAVTQLVPVARQWLGIPDDHVVGYCMAFGRRGQLPAHRAASCGTDSPRKLGILHHRIPPRRPSPS